MKKVFLYFFAFFLILSCSSDDNSSNEECGGVIDFIGPQSFLVEIVDENDTNLIENGFYEKDLISASINGEVFIADDLMPDFIETKNTLFLQTIFGAGENGQWIINLSETDKDTLNYVLSITEVRDRIDNVLFCGSSLNLIGADYNGNSISVTRPPTEINRYNAITIKVVKETDFSN